MDKGIGPRWPVGKQKELQAKLDHTANQLTEAGQNWESTPVSERVKMMKAVGMEGRLASKSWPDAQIILFQNGLDLAVQAMVLGYHSKDEALLTHYWTEESTQVIRITPNLAILLERIK